MRTMMMSAGVMLLMISCKRYTCECSTTTLQSKTEDAYQITAADETEALQKCTNKHSRSSIGAQKIYCEIK
jgi:hypothetical protein